MKLMIALIFVSTVSAAQAQTAATLETGSKLKWIGSPIIGSGHEGTIDIVKGTILLNADGTLTAGDFVMDMHTIRSMDKAGKGPEDHLKDKDFFDVDQFPQAFFSVTRVAPSEDVSKKNQWIVTGFLGLKGITQPITFPFTLTREATTLRVKANFTFDRTKWGVTYNSKSIFDDLKDEVISDDIAVELDLKFLVR